MSFPVPGQGACHTPPHAACPWHPCGHQESPPASVPGSPAWSAIPQWETCGKTGHRAQCCHHCHLPAEELPLLRPKSLLCVQSPEHLPPVRLDRCQGMPGPDLGCQAPSAPLPPRSPKSFPILVPGAAEGTGHGAAALATLLSLSALGHWMAAGARWTQKHRAGGTPCPPFSCTPQGGEWAADSYGRPRRCGVTLGPVLPAGASPGLGWEWGR